MASYDYTFKIMVLGDADTPKTSLINRYISGFYLDDLKLTIGVDFYSKTTLYKGKKVKLQILDFDGEERFRFLLHQYVKGTDAVILLYNITNPSTLEHLPDWIRIVREHAGDIPIILVGAKAHLEQFRAVSKEEGILEAKKYNLSGFIEVSAKTGKNFDQLFEDVIEKSILNVNKRRLKPKKVGKKRKIIKLEKEKLREQSLSREAYKLIQEGTQLKDKTPKEKSQGMYDAAFKIIGDDDEDRFPYPYIFKPPEPPGDLGVETQVQVKRPIYKEPENEKVCQYCGRKLTDEERVSHYCRKRP